MKEIFYKLLEIFHRKKESIPNIIKKQNFCQKYINNIYRVRILFCHNN